MYICEVELGLSTLTSRRKLHLAVTMFNCMLPSPLLIYLSYFLRFQPTTTPTLLHLPSSTFLPIDPPLAKSHSVLWAQHCGDPCHRTSATLKTSLGTTHSASNIFINDIWLACAWHFPDKFIPYYSSVPFTIYLHYVNFHWTFAWLHLSVWLWLLVYFVHFLFLTGCHKVAYG